MCLMGGMNLLVPPSPKARMLAKYFAGAVALQFVLGIFDFLGTRYFDGAFDIVFALIGFCAIKNSDGHSYQQVICYMFLNGFNFVWSILRLILNLAGVRGFKGPSEGWRSDFYMITIGAGPAVYLACTVVAYLLYKELKAILYAEMGQMEGGASGGGAPMGGFGGYAGGAPAASSAPARSSNWASSGGHAVGGGEDEEAGRSYLVHAPAGRAVRAAPGASATPASGSGGSGFKAFGGYGCCFFFLLCLCSICFYETLHRRLSTQLFESCVLLFVPGVSSLSCVVTGSLLLTLVLALYSVAPGMCLATKAQSSNPT